MAGMACNCYTARLIRMLILPVTAFRSNQMPTIGFNQFYNVAYFHIQILAHNAMFDDTTAKKVASHLNLLETLHRDHEQRSAALMRIRFP